jgi:hypothetical protein
METSREEKISKQENKTEFQKDRKLQDWNVRTELLGSKAHCSEEWTNSLRKKMGGEVVVHAKKVGGLAERNEWELRIGLMRQARLWSPDMRQGRSAVVVANI